MPTRTNLCLLVVCFALIFSGCSFQNEVFVQDVMLWQQNQNQQFANPEESPLPKEEVGTFAGLPFFDPDESFLVKARFERTPDAPTFKMPTTTDRLPEYVKYGTASFEMEDKAFKLSVFQNLELVKKEGYEEYLFLPFSDNTNGEETYGGGRYLDLKIPAGSEIEIDFNKAYNPYCAYNDRYSCPIPPSENYMDVQIRAGVKYYENH